MAHCPRIAFAVALVVVGPGLVFGDDTPESTRQVALSGTLAALIPEYRISLTSSLSPGRHEFVGKGREFPIRLPVAKFGAAFIEITDTDGHRLLSVLFDRPLFQGNRDVTIRLDKPTLELSIRGERTLQIDHWAWISEKVCYSDMPNWNEKEKRLVRAGKPVVEVARDKAPSQIMVRRTMRSGCMGYGWLAFLDLPADVKKGETLTVTVIHDTGDLWGRLSIASKHTVE